MTMYSMNVFRKKHKAFEHLLSNFVHSLSNILYIMGVDSCHRGTRRGQNVDMEFSTQSFNLRHSKTSVREHTTLLHNVRPVTL